MYKNYKRNENITYHCPKCGNESSDYHNDYYDMDMIYACLKCNYSSRNEEEFLHNQFTELFDTFNAYTEYAQNSMLCFLNEELHSEKELNKRMWEECGSELCAGDMHANEELIQLKIDILKYLLNK